MDEANNRAYYLFREMMSQMGVGRGESFDGSRELPHSREAEQSVIGSILSNSKSISEAAELVSASDFYIPANREIYSVILELFNENTAIDIVTVSDRLSQKDRLDNVGGIEYLAEIASSVPTTQHVAYYSQIIKEKSMLRKLITAGSAICDMAYSGTDDVTRILDRSENLIFDIANQSEKSDIVPISDVVMETYRELVDNYLTDGKMNGLDTGFVELNNRTGGFHGGELILIAGRPGMGKSSFAVNIAEHAAIKNGKPVAIFNLEMPKTQIVNRILCSQALVETGKLRTGELDPDDWVSVCNELSKIHTSPIYIDDSSTITVSEIRAKCKRLKQTKGLSMIVIDYLQLMQSNRRSENRQQEISEISRSLKVLAKELDIPVVALSQLSRASESRSDKRPMLSDLRESGAIEQDADMVMFLYRDEYYNKESKDRGLAECIVAKHRQGETGTFKLGWKGMYTKFVNVEYVADDGKESTGDNSKE